MPIARWFHERERDETGPNPLVFDIPPATKIKVVYVLLRLIGASDESSQWQDVIEPLHEALGVKILPAAKSLRLWTPFREWRVFLENATYSQLLTGVEVTLDAVQYQPTGFYLQRSLSETVDELNELMGAEHVGFRFIQSDARPFWRAIRVDSEITFDTTVHRPLGALSAAGFQLAEQQFVEALRKRSEGDYAGAITDANAALESVMKRILATEKGQGTDLLNQLSNAGYLPGAMGKTLGPLGDIFELVPVIRNEKSSAHGRLAPTLAELPRYADLALGLTGTFIGFLVDEYLEKSNPSKNA